jgi:hypothetical protein
VATGESDELGIEAAAPAPNPNPLALAVRTKGSAEKIRVTVFSKAMIVVGVYEFGGPTGSAWVQAPLPSLAGGLYYARVSAWRQGREALYPSPLKLLVTR